MKRINTTTAIVIIALLILTTFNGIIYFKQTVPRHEKIIEISYKIGWSNGANWGEGFYATGTHNEPANVQFIRDSIRFHERAKGWAW